jgi:hypothetical protein
VARLLPTQCTTFAVGCSPSRRRGREVTKEILVYSRSGERVFAIPFSYLRMHMIINKLEMLVLSAGKNIRIYAPVLFCKVIMEDLECIVGSVKDNSTNLSVHIPPHMAACVAVPNLHNLFGVIFQVGKYKVFLSAE